MMKKRVAFISLAITLVLSFASYSTADESRIYELRNQLFAQSKELKAILPHTKDQYVVLTLFNSAVISINHIDAYFVMMGLFNAIRREDLNKETVGYLFNWLQEMKKANELNMRSLREFNTPVEKETLKNINKMKTIFGELDLILNKDIVRIGELLRVVKPKAVNKAQGVSKK